MEAMLHTLKHRGPDGTGVWTSENAVFGHARLSIIDIDGGSQPMFNEDQSIVIVLNGEIYNYRDLQQELRGRGHNFQTQSDTEVVIHGYEEWGIRVVDRLRGMFAFAIWDSNRHQLVLARDRYGEKPLYVWHSADGHVAFASEIKAICSLPGFRSAANTDRLGEYLAFRSVAGEETLFRDITEILPGMVGVLDRSGLQYHRFWEPKSDEVLPIVQEDIVGQGRALLRDAVRVRLMSDVPLGTITSGGLDSSLVSAIAAELTSRTLDTFCVGFENPAYDERPFARSMAESIGARFHELEISPADLTRELDSLTWIHDEPLTHPNSIPMHMLFRYAKEEYGVTVLLSGEGADELFGGYDWYRANGLRQRLSWLKPFSPLFPRVGKFSALRRILGADYCYWANAVSSAKQVNALMPGAEDPASTRRPSWNSEADDLSAVFLYDQRTYLPPLLQRQDRMSMAAGVEARVVFLDHFLAEWVNNLPSSVRLAGGHPKPLLKKIAEQWVPRGIIDRRKVGFTIPLGAWFRSRETLGQRLDAIRDAGSFVQSFCDRAEVESLVAEHLRGESDHSDILWSLVSMEAWATQFITSW